MHIYLHTHLHLHTHTYSHTPCSEQDKVLGNFVSYYVGAEMGDPQWGHLFRVTTCVCACVCVCVCVCVSVCVFV